MGLIDEWNKRSDVAPAKSTSTQSQTPQNQVPVAPTKKGGGIGGFLYNTAKSLIHPAAELGNAALNVPVALAREIRNKPINDVQQHVFGTTNQGDIAKKIIGDTAQVGLTAVTPEAGSIVKNAALGAGYGGASALTQNKSSAEDVIKGALTGGVVGGVTGAGGKILQKLTGKVSGAVEGGASKIAAKQTEQKAVQTAAKAAEEEAPYAAISKTGRERGNMRSTLDFFKNKLNMGTDPSALRSGASLVTGENGVVNGTMRKLLGDTGDVPTVDVLSRTKSALVKEAGQLGDVETKGSHANGVLRSVRDTLQGTAYKGEGNLSGEGSAAANNVFDTLQSIEGRIQELSDQGADAAEKRALKATKGALEDSIYKNGNLDKAVAGYKLTPEDISAIHSTAAKTGVSPELAQHVIDGINNATSGKELRSLQAPFVNASKLANVADRAGEGILTDIPKVAPSDPGMFGGRGGFYKALEIGRLVHGDPTAALPLIAGAGGDGATPGIIQKTGEKLVSAGQKVNSAVPGGTGNFMSNLITRAGATQQPNQATDQSAQVPDSPGQEVNPLLKGTILDPSRQTSTEDDIASPSDNPFDPANAQANIEKILAQGGKMADVQQYLATVKTLQDLSGDKMSPTQQKAVTAAKNAKGTLQQIEDSFSAAGGGQGKVGGFLSNLTGKVGANSNVATYNDTATALAASLYKALGNTGTISDKDQQLIAKLIPKTTDTDTTAKAKLAQLENLLQQSQDNLTTQ